MGTTNDMTIARIHELEERLGRHSARVLGFPCITEWQHEDLSHIFRLFLNNAGDPSEEGYFRLQTKDFEQEVLAFFAKLFRAPGDGYGGYVTSGGTEGNLYALYLARHALPKARAYYSDAAHFSVPKALHILGIKAVPVRTLPSGEMDYAHLHTLVKRRPNSPAIVVATVGTTMTEAKDSVAKIRTALQEAGVTRVYIHADAALAGVYTALIDRDHPFDFRDGADSISISGHKFLGMPIPCGIVLARKEHTAARAHENYTGALDSTISGSRSGHAPVLLWWAIQKWGTSGLRSRALACQRVAAYADTALRAANWDAWRNPHALTVVLKAPPQALLHKWQLVTEGDRSHIICMPGVTKQKIDAFVDDLRACEA